MRVEVRHAQRVAGCIDLGIAHQANAEEFRRALTIDPNYRDAAVALLGLGQR